MEDPVESTTKSNNERIQTHICRVIDSSGQNIDDATPLQEEGRTSSPHEANNIYNVHSNVGPMRVPEGASDAPPWMLVPARLSREADFDLLLSLQEWKRGRSVKIAFCALERLFVRDLEEGDGRETLKRLLRGLRDEEEAWQQAARFLFWASREGRRERSARRARRAIARVLTEKMSMVEGEDERRRLKAIRKVRHAPAAHVCIVTDVDDIGEGRWLIYHEV